MVLCDILLKLLLADADFKIGMFPKSAEYCFCWPKTFYVLGFLFKHNYYNHIFF